MKRFFVGVAGLFGVLGLLLSGGRVMAENSAGSKPTQEVIGKITAVHTTCWVTYAGSTTRVSTSAGQPIKDGGMIEVPHGHYAVMALKPETSKDIVYVHGGTTLKISTITGGKRRLDLLSGKIVAFFNMSSPYYEVYSGEMALLGPSGCFQAESNSGSGSIAVYDGAVRVSGVVAGGKLSLNSIVLNGNQWASVSSMKMEANQVRTISADEYQKLMKLVKESVPSETDRMTRIQRSLEDAKSVSADHVSQSVGGAVRSEEHLLLPDAGTITKTGVNPRDYLEDAQRDGQTNKAVRP